MTPLFYRSLLKHKPLTNSLLAGLIISATSLYAPMINAAPIYKVIDDKTGQVTFTDNPQSYEQQAGKQVSQTGITTGNSTSANNERSSNRSDNNTSTANTATKASSPSNAKTRTADTAPATTQTPNIEYQLTMTEPSESRAYQRPAQIIEVTVQTQPALQAGDSVSIYLDSTVVAQGTSASIATVDLLPGEHSVQAVIRNKEGQVLKQISRTVYVIQNTLTLRDNKKIAEQLLAYERLPWHQKVLLKLRQDNKQPNMPLFINPSANTPMTLEQPVIK